MRKSMVVVAKCLLLALFVSYWAGAKLFTHTHVVDGNLISHSHPYLPSNAHSHSHCATAFQLVDNLTNLIFTSVGAQTFAFMALAHRFVRVVYDVVIRECSFSLHCPLRAPPVY